MFPRLRALRLTTLLQISALVVAVVSVPLVLTQTAGADGTFVPSGSSVTIAFASSNGAATDWIFGFSGDVPMTGTCPPGGTFVANYSGMSNEADCSFSPSTMTSGSVTINLAAVWGCGTPINDSVIVNGPAGPVTYPEQPITCSAENTTTTNPVGGTTTTTSQSTTTTSPAGGTTTTTTQSTTTTTPQSTTTTTTPGTGTTSTTIPAGATTTTQPTSTTTSTLAPGPCKCQSLVVSLRPSDVTAAHLPSAGASVTLTRVTLKVTWTLSCTKGLGNCRSRVVVKPPPGATTLYLKLPSSGGSGGSGGGTKSGHRFLPLAITCVGPCGATTHGSFYVQTVIHGPLASRTLYFLFVANCSGQDHTQTIKLVWGSNGALDRKASTLGIGKSG
ncbi:MAG: hypothetical protein ACHQFZ_08435 [Acidimicrobiales bacterium]